MRRAPGAETLAGGVPGTPWDMLHPRAVQAVPSDQRRRAVARAGSPAASSSSSSWCSPVAAGAVVVVAVRTIQGLTQDAVNEATGRALDPGAEPGDADPGSGPAAAKYGLTESGISGFLKVYRERFGTNRVVDLTMYGDYAIVNVPKPKSRQEAGSTAKPRGSPASAVSGPPSPARVRSSTNRLAIPALVRNIARARATLNVEDPTQTYVIVRFIPGRTGAERDIHVGNEFNESGYMATTLDGKVKQHPIRGGSGAQSRRTVAARSVDEGLDAVGEHLLGEHGGAGDVGALDQVGLDEAAALGALAAHREGAAGEDDVAQLGQRGGQVELELLGPPGYGEPGGLPGQPERDRARRPRRRMPRR